MCTLSPAEPHYSPYYDNNDQSADYRTAHGFNYHQVPLSNLGIFVKQIKLNLL